MNTFYTIEGLKELIKKANKRGDFLRAKKIMNVVDILDMYGRIDCETRLYYAKGYVKIAYYNNKTSIVPYSKIRDIVDDYILLS